MSLQDTLGGGGHTASSGVSLQDTLGGGGTAGSGVSLQDTLGGGGAHCWQWCEPTGHLGGGGAHCWQ